ncbi:MAG TPA: SRPBCC domain-containing protein [Rugosimonospora sp.]|nr:SRPBCC domain-containing protein [Rugosimonospora sp.]
MTGVVRVERTLTASVERVWRAFTEPERLAAWFWPERMGTVAEIDLRPGGRYALTAPGAGLAVTGEYHLVEPPTRLVFTWQWAGEPETTLVTVALTALEGTGTTLVVTHERFADAGARDNHAQGWRDCLDRLPEYLAAAG